MKDQRPCVSLFTFFNDIEALKIAIEARLQKISVYSKENNLTNNTNTLKASKKKLNPITNRTGTNESLDLNSLIDTKKRLQIDTQSPKGNVDIKTSQTTKTGKGVKEFFVTQELLNPLGNSFISHKDEGKNTPG